MDKVRIINMGKVITLLLVIINLAILDLSFIFKKETAKEETVSFEQPLVSPPPLTVPNSKEEGCPEACLETIYKATAAGKIVTPSVTSIPTTGLQIKEFYIPLGTGSTTATSWTDLAGAEAYIDPSNYGKIKSLTFEASLRVPSSNGRVYARLYNVNDKIGIFESEVSAEGSNGTRVESSKINLPSGNKLYRVQLKTTMGVEGDLDMGRVKILVE